LANRGVAHPSLEWVKNANNEERRMWMSTDSKTQLEPIVSAKEPKITLNHPRLKAIQRRAAWAATLIPALGSVLAFVIALQTGIGPVEIGLLVMMYSLTAIGISVGYHRYFCHCTFQTNTTVRVILAILGSMALMGTVTSWVADHRRHHKYTDAYGDPHSPHCHDDQRLTGLRGLWHAHVSWMFNSDITNFALFAKDLLQDSTLVKVNRLYWTWVMLGLGIPAVLGGILTASWMGALQGFLWGGLVRIFLINNILAWGNNSIGHYYGSRPFKVNDQSRNNFWLAVQNFGEGWHNNHHAFPNSAIMGLEWWQIDMGGWVIRVLEKLGLAWEVKVPSAAAREAKRKEVEKAEG
jgi:stearoyl-CoA desaturase (delta-9 desaturase)